MAWKMAVERKGPTALVFTRQGLPHQQRNAQQLEDVSRGGYVLRAVEGEPDAIIMATGSEVGLAMKAADELASSGCHVNVVSMPNPDLFLEQDVEYRKSGSLYI